MSSSVISLANFSNSIWLSNLISSFSLNELEIPNQVWRFIRYLPGDPCENSISSLVFSTEDLLAASSSKISICLEFIIASQFSQKFFLHKFSKPFLQFKDFATILAIVVLPIPRIPVKR